MLLCALYGLDQNTVDKFQNAVDRFRNNALNDAIRRSRRIAIRDLTLEEQRVKIQRYFQFQVVNKNLLFNLNKRAFKFKLFK